MSDAVSGDDRAPTRCLYCDGANPDCGFCEMGQPLDTQEDWDRTWGRTFDAMSAAERAARERDARIRQAMTQARQRLNAAKKDGA